jgi:hypothetical protein
MNMIYKPIHPEHGNYIQINNADWFVFDTDHWRKMSLDEMLELSTDKHFNQGDLRNEKENHSENNITHF